MRVFFTLVFFYIHAVLVAQTTPPVVIGSRELPMQDIGQFTEFYEDKSGDTLPLATIQKQHFLPFAKKRNERTTPSDRSLLVTWLRFRIRNTHPTDTLRLFYEVSSHSFITFYAGNQRILKTGISSKLTADMPTQSSVLLTILPGQEQTYYVQVIDYIISVMPILSLLSSFDEAFKAGLAGALFVAPLFLIMAIIAGCLLFMSVYAVYHYGLTRDKAYLYYSLYAFTGFYFAFLTIDSRFSLGILYTHFPSPALSPITPSLITFFYSLFIGRLITIRQQFPKTWHCFRDFLSSC